METLILNISGLSHVSENFSESWLKPDISDTLVDIDGYTLYRQIRNFKNEKGYHKRGGGLILYVKNSFDIVVGNMFKL